MKNTVESLLLVGCGNMGGAMLRGWLAGGLAPERISVLDPRPTEWLLSQVEAGVTLNQQPALPPSVVVLATKPQIMAEAVPEIRSFGQGDTLFISVAAGTLIATLEDLLGAGTPVVRAMPNTPAAIGEGVTGLVANAAVTPEQKAMAEELMQAVGATVSLDDEELMHGVTALSGSGPAYVFAMAEAMIAAGVSAGLSSEISRDLALGTIRGAALLMAQSDEPPGVLRARVTSPNGTTAAGLAEFMAKGSGIAELTGRTVEAARNRSVELSEAG